MSLADVLPLATTFPVGLALLLKPQPVAQLMGKVYWKAFGLTPMEKSEKRKDFFFPKSLFWFRALGVVFICVSIVGVYARSSQ